MKKIPCLFLKDDIKKPVVDKVNPLCQWVADGEGLATRKFDGTCCLIENGKLFARHTVKKNKKQPEDFIPVTDIDPNTGKQEGWVPVTNDPKFKYHRLAMDYDLPDGSYELCGPSVQGNPEKLNEHKLIHHGCVEVENVPRDFDGLKKLMSDFSHEGIVFWHPDGRKAKIRKKDF